MKTKEVNRNRVAAYVSLAVIIIALGVTVASWFIPNDNSDDSAEETAPTTTSEHNPLMDKMVTGTQQPGPVSVGRGGGSGGGGIGDSFLGSIVCFPVFGLF